MTGEKEGQGLSPPPFAGLIDIHCHILPGLDDGAESEKIALAMARTAVKDGVVEMVATPHIWPGRYDNTPQHIAAAALALQNRLHEEEIALKLRWAADLRLHPRLLGMIRRGELPDLGGQGMGPYFLLELNHGRIAPGSLYLSELLVMKGMIPIITHPERCGSIMRDVDRLTPYMEMGCLSQITAASLTGEFGQRAKKTGFRLLEVGWAHFIASDGHGFYQRPPLLSEGIRAAAQVVGEETALAMATRNPQKLLAGEPIGDWTGSGGTPDAHERGDALSPPLP